MTTVARMDRRRLPEPVALLCRSVLRARLVLLPVAVLSTWTGTTPRAATAAATVLAVLVSCGPLLAWPATRRTAGAVPFAVVDGLAGLGVLALVGGASPFAPLLLSGPLLAGLLHGRRGGLSAGAVLATAGLVASPGGRPALSVAAGLLPYFLAAVAGAEVRASLDRSEDTASGAWLRVRAVAAAEERRRLARELHDSVVKTLHGLRLLTATLQSGDREAQTLAALEGSLAVALSEARALVGDLRFESPDEPLDQAVRRAATDWSLRHEAAVQVRTEQVGELPPEAGYELGCVLREALENVARHAGAAHVDVRLSRDEADVRLEVADDGRGFLYGPDREQLAARGHFGLVGMHERARRVGGTLQVDTHAGGGTRIVLRVPAPLPEQDGTVARPRRMRAVA